MSKFQHTFSNAIDEAKPVKGATVKKPVYGKNYEIPEGTFELELKHHYPMEHEKYMPKYCDD